MADVLQRARDLYLSKYPEAPLEEWHRLPGRTQAEYVEAVELECLGTIKTVYARRVAEGGGSQAYWYKAGMVCMRCFTFWPAVEPE